MGHKVDDNSCADECLGDITWPSKSNSKDDAKDPLDEVQHGIEKVDQ